MDLAKQLFNQINCNVEETTNPLGLVTDALIHGNQFQQFDQSRIDHQYQQFEDCWDNAQVEDQFDINWRQKQVEDQFTELFQKEMMEQEEISQLDSNSAAYYSGNKSKIISIGQVIDIRQMLSQQEAQFQSQESQQNYQIWQDECLSNQWDSRSYSSDSFEEQLNMQDQDKMMVQLLTNFNLDNSSKSSEREYHWIGYPFQTKNPYRFDSNVKEIAIEKVDQGDVHEAILALESALQMNPNHSEFWRLLGQMHAENDQDELALSAFKRGFEIDPYNLEIILSLGVCCTNQLKKKDAVTYLKQWITSHPEYSIIQNKITQDDQFIKVLEKANKINPNDQKVLQALGILFVISKDYTQALNSFEKASQLNPQDHILLNQIGVTYINLENSQAAIEFYLKALDRRPGYVRAWVNTGIAYQTQRNFQEAARFYLCALSLNPQAAHIWKYLKTLFILMKRTDLFFKIKNKDPLSFRDEFDVITWADIPKLSAN